MLKFRYFLVVVLFPLMSVFSQGRVNQVDSNGLKTGKWVKKYNNGNIRYSGQFIRDKEVGVFKFYSEFYSNHPLIVKSFSVNSSTCSVQFFTITGIKESEGDMIDKDRVGKWLYYDGTGENIILEENYVQGKLSGEMKIFYPDGTLTEISHFKNGLLHGESLRYTDQGKLIEKIPYNKGKIHGKVYYYHHDGVIRETGHYDFGKRVGRWEFYIDGELAGVEEPNKKVEKEPITLEELQRRKKK